MRYTCPYSPKMFFNVDSLQMSRFMDETCSVFEGGLIVIERFAVKLNQRVSTGQKMDRNTHISSIFLLQVSKNLRFQGFP